MLHNHNTSLIELNDAELDLVAGGCLTLKPVCEPPPCKPETCKPEHDYKPEHDCKPQPICR